MVARRGFGRRRIVQRRRQSPGAAPPAGPTTWLTGDGTSGIASTPDSAALSITGDIDLRIRARLVDWSPTLAQAFILKRHSSDSATGEWQWSNDADTGGTGAQILRWRWFDSIGTNTTNASTTHAGVNGEWLSLRVTFDVDDGAGNRVLTFQESADADLSTATWTTVGTAITTAGTTNIRGNVANLVEIGSQNTGTTSFLIGDVAAAQIRNGIGGTIVGSPDFTALTGGQTSYTDAQGNVWTFGSGVTIGGLGGGAVALAGSDGVGLDGSAALSVALPLAGSDGAGFDGSGQLSVARPLAGSDGIGLDGSAALTVARPLAGSDGVGLDGSGDLTVTPAGIALAGSDGLGFDGSGQLSVARPLAGTDGIGLDGSAALAVARPLAGSDGLGFDGSGALDTTAGTTLTGSDGIGLDGSAALSVARPLTGSDGIGLDGSAALAVARPLQGSDGAGFGGTGDLTVTAASVTELAGTGGIAFDGSGQLSVARPLAGSDGIAFGGSGVMGALIEFGIDARGSNTPGVNGRGSDSVGTDARGKTLAGVNVR
jgi:hypothetical protein